MGFILVFIVSWLYYLHVNVISSFQYQVLDDIDSLRHFLDEEQTPAECGGPTSHDQLEWVEFYKVRMPTVPIWR